MSEFPATCIVHWPTGPVAACEEHAQQLVGLSNFLGSHIAVTTLDSPAECVNCQNEAPQTVTTLKLEEAK